GRDQPDLHPSREEGDGELYHRAVRLTPRTTGDEHEAVRLTPRTTGDEHEAVRLRPRKEKRWGKGSSKTQEVLWNTLPHPTKGPAKWILRRALVERAGTSGWEKVLQELTGKPSSMPRSLGSGHRVVTTLPRV